MVINPTCYNCANGKIIVDIEGPVKLYQYSTDGINWSYSDNPNLTNTKTYSGLLPGVYTVYVDIDKDINTHKCFKVLTFNLTPENSTGFNCCPEIKCECIEGDPVPCCYGPFEPLSGKPLILPYDNIELLYYQFVSAVEPTISLLDACCKTITDTPTGITITNETFLEDGNPISLWIFRIHLASLNPGTDCFRFRFGGFEDSPDIVTPIFTILGMVDVNGDCGIDYKNAVIFGYDSDEKDCDGNYFNDLETGERLDYYPEYPYFGTAELVKSEVDRCIIIDDKAYNKRRDYYRIRLCAVPKTEALKLFTLFSSKYSYFRYRNSENIQFKVEGFTNRNEVLDSCDEDWWNFDFEVYEDKCLELANQKECCEIPYGHVEFNITLPDQNIDSTFQKLYIGDKTLDCPVTLLNEADYVTGLNPITYISTIDILNNIKIVLEALAPTNKVLINEYTATIRMTYDSYRSYFYSTEPLDFNVCGSTLKICFARNDGSISEQVKGTVTPIRCCSRIEAEKSTIINVASASPKIDTNVTVQPCSPKIDTNVQVQPCNPKLEQITNISPCNPDIISNVTVNPCNPDIVTNLTVSPCNPDINTSIIVQPCTPKIETNLTVNPCNPDIISNVTVSPCTPKIENNLSVQPCNPDIINEIIVQPCTPKIDTNITVTPCNPDIVSNITINPCNPILNQYTTISPCNPKIENNISVSPCNPDVISNIQVTPCNPKIENNVSISPCNPSINQSVTVQPCTPKIENNIAISPCNPDIINNIQIQPCNPVIENNLVITPCNPDIETTINVSPCNPKIENNLTIQPCNPVVSNTVNVSPCNPVIESNVTVNPCNPVIESNVTVQPCNPNINNTINISPCNPVIESNITVNPCNPNIDTSITINPCNPKLEYNLTVSPCNPKIENNINVSPCTPNVANTINVSPCNPNIENNITVAPCTPNIENNIVVQPCSPTIIVEGGGGASATGVLATYEEGCPPEHLKVLLKVANLVSYQNYNFQICEINLSLSKCFTITAADLDLYGPSWNTYSAAEFFLKLNYYLGSVYSATISYSYDSIAGNYDVVLTISDATLAMIFDIASPASPGESGIISICSDNYYNNTVLDVGAIANNAITSVIAFYCCGEACSGGGSSGPCDCCCPCNHRQALTISNYILEILAAFGGQSSVAAWGKALHVETIERYGITVSPCYTLTYRLDLVPIEGDVFDINGSIGLQSNSNCVKSFVFQIEGRTGEFGSYINWRILESGIMQQPVPVPLPFYDDPLPPNYTVTSGIEISNPCPMGPPGVPGVSGPQGEQGEQGQQGPQGIEANIKELRLDLSCRGTTPLPCPGCACPGIATPIDLESYILTNPNNASFDPDFMRLIVSLNDYSGCCASACGNNDIYIKLPEFNNLNKTRRYEVIVYNYQVTSARRKIRVIPYSPSDYMNGTQGDYVELNNSNTYGEFCLVFDECPGPSPLFTTQVYAAWTVERNNA